MNYARAVLSRPYIFTIVFLVANLFVFLLMWESSEMKTDVLWSAFPEEVLIAYGAKTNYWIHNGHQYWRFVTPIFIHVNLIHVAINMYGLWMIGPWVEKLYGSAKFVVFWVATGVAGVLASYLTYVPGAHPGLIASFLGRVVWTGRCAIRLWTEVPARVARRFPARLRHRHAAGDPA